MRKIHYEINDEVCDAKCGRVCRCLAAGAECPIVSPEEFDTTLPEHQCKKCRKIADKEKEKCKDAS